MSNAVVGSVYEQIIEDVLSTSRVDFEENGVDEGVLEDLRLGWQNRLTQFNVAHFPWDPKPELDVGASSSTAAGSSSTTVMGTSHSQLSMTTATDNGSFSQSTMSPLPASSQYQQHQNHQNHQQLGGGGLPMPSLPMPSFDGVKQEHVSQQSIKLELDANGSGMPIPTMPPLMPSYPTMAPAGAGPGAGSSNAAARAVQQLQNTFGQRAAKSINAIHSGMTAQQQQQLAQQQQRAAVVAAATSTHGGQTSMNAQQQYRAQVAAQTAAQLNGAEVSAGGGDGNGGSNNGSNGNNASLARSQMDGGINQEVAADDDDYSYEGVLLQPGAQASATSVELGRVVIDHLLHEQMARRAKQMEGGGLMVPLRKLQARRKTTKTRRSAGTAAVEPTVRSIAADGTGPTRHRQTHLGQMDGGDEDDELDTKERILDEDAINSDLDDPDDNREEDDDEDDVMAPIMLCVYDKVQRVKNKWKCVLKDGVLTVNGKEYVFHKATGEFEW